MSAFSRLGAFTLAATTAFTPVARAQSTAAQTPTTQCAENESQKMHTVTGPMNFDGDKFISTKWEMGQDLRLIGEAKGETKDGKYATATVIGFPQQSATGEIHIDVNYIGVQEDGKTIQYRPSQPERARSDGDAAFASASPAARKTRLDAISKPLITSAYRALAQINAACAVPEGGNTAPSQTPAANSQNGAPRQNAAPQQAAQAAASSDAPSAQTSRGVPGFGPNSYASFVFPVDNEYPAKVQITDRTPGLKDPIIVTIEVNPQFLTASQPVGGSAAEVSAVAVAQQHFQAGIVPYGKGITNGVIVDPTDKKHEVVAVQNGAWVINYYNYGDKMSQPNKHEDGIFAFKLNPNGAVDVVQMKFTDGLKTAFNDSPDINLASLKGKWVVSTSTGDGNQGVVYNQLTQQTTANTPASNAIYGKGVLPQIIREAVQAADEGYKYAQSTYNWETNGAKLPELRGKKQLEDMLKLTIQ